MEKVLIVEDSDADQFYSKRMIGMYDEKIEVVQAYNGKEALDMLRVMLRKPDVIFLDINMPIMNGLEFLDSYYAAETEHSPVIILSSSDNFKDKEKVFQYGCVKKYVLKSLDRDDLAMIAAL